MFWYFLNLCIVLLSIVCEIYSQQQQRLSDLNIKVTGIKGKIHQLYTQG